MEAELVKNVKHTSNIPRKDADVNALGTSVYTTWKLNPGIGLIWITPAAHETNVKAFAAILTDRNSAGGGRSEISQKLKGKDAAIDKGVSAVKNLLVNKYESTAPSYYAQFGIEHVRNNYIIPRDRNKRRAALPLMIAAIAAHGFADEKYGTAYWQLIKDSYETLLDQATNVDGSVSTKVSTKNELRKTIIKTHNALINILRGNYPDTYPAVMREWGFQKEKY